MERWHLERKHLACKGFPQGPQDAGASHSSVPRWRGVGGWEENNSAVASPGTPQNALSAKARRIMECPCLLGRIHPAT